MGRVSDARERLVEAATDLIWLESYGAVGVDAICERADVRKGSFYHFFRSKDELVIAALEANWQARVPLLEAIFSPDIEPLARFSRYFAYVHTRQCRLREKYGRVVGCLYASIGTECMHHSPAIAAKTKQILNLYRRVLEKAIRDAEASGALARGDARARARMLFAYVEGVLGQARIHDDLGMIKQLRQTGFELLGASPSKRVASAHVP